MATFHKHAQTRQVIDWEYITASLGESFLIPITPAVFHVASELLASRGIWPSTFRDGEPTSLGYYSPDTTSEAWLQYKQEVADFISDGIDFMTKFDDFLKSQLRIEAALTGNSLNLDSIPGYFTGSIDSIGVTPAIEANNPNTKLTTIGSSLSDVVTQLSAIKAAIEAQSTGDPEQLADDLEGIVNTIQTVATVLGALA